MLDTINAKLEASRKELLDLGLRNPLLNYKTPKGKGLKIVREKSEFIFDILTRQSKAMTFLGVPEKNGAGNFEDSAEYENDELPELAQPLQEEAYRDTKLQTNEIEQKLQTKLLNIYYFARTSVEEQGVNILYLALGMLKWYEAGNTENAHYAPLLLVPVSLERSSAQERFRLRYTGSDIGANLSLQAKMRADFNITIPDLPEAEDMSVSGYFEEIARHISKQPFWLVDADAIELGFFSFGKFMIYNDLDSERWPEAQKPSLSEHIKSLFETGFQNNYYHEEEEAKDLDEETSANTLYKVVDADSSQMLSILAVNDGHNLVIQGPPGTGKSQTITNIIANAVGQGKKVLFVAEKMAALEVVKRRLDAIQLGEPCLELHSHKANKKDLLAELKRVMELGKPAISQLEQEIQLLASYRNELNAYCNAVNTAIAGSGLSTQQVIGFLLQIDEIAQQHRLIKIHIGNIDSWDVTLARAATEMCDRLQARLRDVGVPEQLLFWGTGLTTVLPHEKAGILQQLQEAKQAIAGIINVTQRITAQTGLDIAHDEVAAQDILSQLQLAGQAPDLRGLDIMSDIWLLKKRDVVELLATGRELETIYREYKDVLLNEAWSQNVLEIRQNLVTYGHKWYKFLIGGYRKSKQQLASFLKTTLPDDLAGMLKITDAIAEARHLSQELQEMEPLATRLFGQRWLKQRSDWQQLQHAASYLANIRQQQAEGKINRGLLAYLSQGKEPIMAAQLANDLLSQLTHTDAQVATALAAIQMEAPSATTFVQREECFSRWINHFPELQQAMDWNNLAAVANSSGFGFLVATAQTWDGAASHLKTALLKTWYEYLIEQAFRLSPALNQFERTSHEEVVEKFKHLDQLNLHYNRARVALKHWESVPKQQAGGQVNVLRSEFNRRARHMPIRRLVEEAGAAMQAIKPVWMMSPMSIANFLPPGGISFDLVIFDEASQVRPVDALGAIMRGKQLVVVGDTRQLPPTSFFDKLNTDVDDEDNQTADMQSILGMCDGQGMPNSMLKWHYRSRHESLISLSNHEFYENKLVIFPSPGSLQRLGLRFNHIAEAIYDRGKTRTNPIEAEKVATAVIAHAKNSPNLSLGVVAFSTSQMQAIQAALEVQRRVHPELETFFKSHPHEPFFVKNLENVQGDERDVIFISIGYGRIENGTVPMSFGPLNNEGGERRLNVLITRAKMRCEVFTNIAAADLTIGANAKFGIRALKSFLYFAQFGRLENAHENIITDVRPFEEK